MNFDLLKFRYPWRPYQQRVLDAIDEHLDDQRLHIVAAPGAGKTTLGLEVFRRLGKRTLVLSPTRVIRDQWIQRLDDFCSNTDSTPGDWASNQLSAPKTLTSVTYQAIHAKLSDDLETDDVIHLDDDIEEGEMNVFIQALKQHNVEVMIMDEAHHLRAEWWRALDKVFEALPGMVLVSLTATPPYDAQDHEWRKYEQLCGPIDEEISVPELVKAGTLCPHQDFIWAMDVSPSEQQRIKEYDERVSSMCNTLFEHPVFNTLILAHPWLTVTFDEQAVIRSPHTAIAILTFMKARQHDMPSHLLTTLDLTLDDIPELGRHWWQLLVEALLFSDTFVLTKDDELFVRQLKKQLTSTELLRKRELSLERSRRIERSLSLSPTKVNACVEIHKLEYKQRGNKLCQVILTDYIRDEELNSGLDTGQINLGAWPVFQGLVSQSVVPQQLALLTGRLSIIHVKLTDRLLRHVDKKRFAIEPMPGMPDYSRVTGPLNQLTGAFTALLMNGSLKTLVGTRALLGEGWDAPAINSLILASSVGSFMLTNQMRGRAIRIDKNNPDKISSIWHLVAVDTKSYSGLGDYSDLYSRFETFVGLSEHNKTIESGFDRIKASGLKLLYNPQHKTKAVSKNNREMKGRFKKRRSISQRWHDALIVNESARIIPSVKTPIIEGIRRYHIKHTLGHLIFQLVLLLSNVAVFVFYYFQHDFKSLLLFLGIGLTGVLLYKLPKTIALARILFKHLPIDGSLKHIGVALSHALCQAGLIETSIRRIKVNVLQAQDKTFYLALAGSTFYESSLFADCLAEILAPIDNPRYLVLREGEIYGLKRDDYHAVPLQLAVKKDLAAIFYKAWCKYVGPSELIYTRNKTGRERLLKAKMQAFSSVFERKIKRQDRWQ